MIKKQLSIVLPCLNESKTLLSCIRSIQKELYKLTLKGYTGEIIVIDNNSEDNSYLIAKNENVRVFLENQKGYGSALRKGFSHARGEFVIMLDCDNSYDYSQIPTIVSSFEKGYDFVLASRFLGSIEKGAMPFINRYIGNPLLTFLVNWAGEIQLSDSQTGMRGMRSSYLKKCTFYSTGMEFASELILEMVNKGAKVTEIPIDYKMRIGRSKLNPLLDGLRHLRLILNKKKKYLENDTKILGISEEHDSGTAIIDHGVITFASNEERYTGKKFQYGFPLQSLTWISKNLNMLEKKQITVAVASNFHITESLGNWQNMNLPFKLIEAIFHYISLDRYIWGSPLGHYLLLLISTFTNIFRKRRILQHLKILGYKVKTLSFVDHHTCHAASTFYASGWNEGLVITQDASGDGYCSKVFIASNGMLKQVHSIPFFHSPGHYYEYVTLLLGFKIGREGKVTGLAATGDATKTYPIFSKLLVYDPIKHQFHNNGSYRSYAINELKEMLKPFSREDIAAGVQKHLEIVMKLYISDMLNLYGHGKKTRLALAGGVFANVKLNQVISELDLVKEVFIFPHMGDGGLAAGAALYKQRHNSYFKDISLPALKNAYLGDRTDQKDVIDSISKNKKLINVIKPLNLSLKVAQLLADGNTVAIVRDEMEYGPRALGHRSILYQATDPTVNDWLNKRLNRSEFMPFAPLIRTEDIQEYFTGWEKVTQPLKYMTVTLTCNSKCKKEAPAIVHKDSTARPQSISKDMQPFLYQVLSNYYKIKKLKIVINTSFNMHESPIVRTPDDAIKTFLQGKIDYLVLNKYLISRLEANAK